MEFPVFDVRHPDLNYFILELVDVYRSGKIKSWGELEEKVNFFFTPEKMTQMEESIPGWIKMASFSGGITLTHVICVFLGMFLLPEYQKLTAEQQQLAKWIVLFHDVEKETIQGKRDLTHGFRGAAFTAKILSDIKFPVTSEFANSIDSWADFTGNASIPSDLFSSPIQDNSKLPEIISGIERVFGKNTAAALITKGVLLHMSINVVKDYPQSAPLTMDEIILYVDDRLKPLLKTVMLADNNGWSLFYPEISLKQRKETVAFFEEVEKITHINKSKKRGMS